LPVRLLARIFNPRFRRRFAAAVLMISILTGLVVWYVVLAWQTGLFPGTLPLAELPPAQERDRVLVVAPHEDDESLACAGYLSRSLQDGAETSVCLMTMGEGEELGAAWATRSLHLTPQKFQRLGNLRRQETLKAMRRIGVDIDRVTFLGYPNNGLDSMWSAGNWDGFHRYTSPYLRADLSPYGGIVTPSAPFCGSQVISDLSAVLRQTRPTEVFTCHPADIHRDHWATYCFTRLALEQIARETGGEWARSTRVYTYLVHRWNWPVPLGYYPRESLLPPAPLEALRINKWLTFPLEEEEVYLKRMLVAGYRSQMANSRFNLLLRSFPRHNELFAVMRDMPLSALGNWPTDDPRAGEPIGDHRLLREWPAADIAKVQMGTFDEWLRLRVDLVAPISDKLTYLLLLHQSSPAAHQPRVLQVQVKAGQTPEVVATTDEERLIEAKMPRVVPVARDNVIEVDLPQTMFAPGSRVMIDVIARRGEHVLDHSMTRVFPIPEPIPQAPEATVLPPVASSQPAGTTATVSKR
jgi:LmbE family N-acetylglucosaminyl deacetylase